MHRHGPASRTDIDVVHALRRVVVHLQRMMATAPTGGLTMADFLVLHHVLHQGRGTPKDIAQWTGLTTGSVTKLIDRLASRGFVRRTPNPNDRRSVMVDLDQGGHGQIAAAMQDLHNSAAHMFHGWTDQDKQGLTRLLERLDLGAS